MRSSKRYLIVAVPVGLGLAVVMLAFLAAQRALTRSTVAVRTAHQLQFALTTIDTAAASRENAGFETVASPTSFHSGVFLGSNLYLAGPGGVSVYGLDGILLQRLRTGVELPVTPVVAMATGRLRGATDAQVFLATAGAGLLLLQPAPNGHTVLQQLVPATEDARSVTAVLALPSGDLLLGTRRAGLLLYDGSKLRPFPFNLTADGASSEMHEITALAAVDSTSFLVGTRSAGAVYVHGGTSERLNVASGLPDAQVEALLVEGRTAFIGTPRGVAEIKLLDESPRPVRILAPDRFSHALAFDPASNQLEVGTIDEGVLQVSLNATQHPRSAPIGAPHDGDVSANGGRVDQFLSPAGAPGQMYALMDGAVVRRTGSAWTPALAGARPALADGNVSALAFAPDGRLYVGFFDHGLDSFEPDSGGQVRHGQMRHIQDDHLFCVNRLVVDPERHTVAAATANGLVLLDAQGTPRQVLTRRDGLISDHVTDVVFRKDSMTVATPAGLSFVGANGIDSLYGFQGLVNNHVYALGVQPGTGRLLAGTLGGLSMLDAGGVRRNITATNSGLKHNWITAIVPMTDGGTLLGTYGAGLQKLSRDGTVTSVDLPAGMPRNLIVNPNASLVTQGHVYVGTLDHGMLVWSASSGRWSAVTHGLPSLNVTAFAERDGELYVGTENGLVRIAEARLEGMLQ